MSLPGRSDDSRTPLDGVRSTSVVETSLRGVGEFEDPCGVVRC